MERFLQNGFEQAAAVGVGTGELRIEPVAQRHQFVDIGDDPLLLGEGREGD